MTNDDGWEFSTEGELDPDLTEEAGYAGWEPPRRAWAPILARALATLVILGFMLGVLAVFLR